MYRIEETLGFYPITVEAMVLTDIRQYSISVSFLGLVFDLVTLVFAIISILLIYSLLMIMIETRTFEIGVMRMQGFKKKNLIVMVFIQSLLFVIPALVMGFILSVPCLKLASYAFKVLLNQEI